MYYSSNSFPQLTSSSPHSHANAFFSHHTPNENLLQDPFSYNFFPSPNINADPCPFIIDNDATATATDTDTEGFVRALQVKEDHPLCDPLSNYLITNKKSRVNKKDRHSMIFTAQGLRHRRVRLSIDISRKFFNLQDMLGFDKASQTLDWLFTNSKTAIQKLMQTNNYSLLPKSSSSSECDELKILSQNKGDEERNSKIHGTTGNEKKSRSPNKETREKARARARERTQHKQRIRKLDQQFKKRIPPQHENLISSRSSGENITMPALPISGNSLGDETSWKDIIVEAILTKKPLKSCLIDVYQQNMPVPEEIMVQSELFSHY